MTNHKIIVIPGAKKGINIPIALQSCVCRYYLENEHKKQVMPECEISFNDHMPRIKHHALTIREKTVLVIATRLLMAETREETLKTIESNNSIQYYFVMEREKMQGQQLSKWVRDMNKINVPDIS